MLYRGTLCGVRDCSAVATHVVRLLIPKYGAPFDKRVPMDALISCEVCEAHSDKAAFVADIKAAGLVAGVQNFLRASGQAPADIGRAVVRLIRKDDAEQYQFPSR